MKSRRDSPGDQSVGDHCRETTAQKWKAGGIMQQLLKPSVLVTSLGCTLTTS